MRIYDSAVTFSIQNVATGAYVVQPGPTRRPRSTRRAIVYGYNLRVSTAGEYEITYVTHPRGHHHGGDAGPSPGDDTVTLRITVTGGGGGGGGADSVPDRSAIVCHGR